MQIFDDIKSRGVQEVGFICMDGLNGLEEGAKAIFPNTLVQRCIVHLIRNSLKYVPTKDYKDFCAHLKKIYAAPSLKAAQVEFERFCQLTILHLLEKLCTPPTPLKLLIQA